MPVTASSSAALARTFRAALRRLLPAAKSGVPRRLLVAVSGGPDSVALLALAVAAQRALRIEVAAAHVDHRLRGRESDADARFVARLAARFGVPCLLRQANAAAERDAAGISLEDAARRVRYRALAEMAREWGAGAVATGHTLDDQAETVLLRLIAGAGPGGLAGVRESVEMRTAAGKVHVVRPLLAVRRAELRLLLRERGLRFRSDSSNRDTAFARNRLRRDVMPALVRFDSAAPRALARVATVMAELDAGLDEQARRWLARHARRQGADLLLPAARLAALGMPMAKRIADLAAAELAGPDTPPLGFAHFDLLRRLWSPGSRARAVALPARIAARRDGEVVRMSPEAAVRQTATQFRYNLRPNETLPIHECGVELRSRMVSRGLGTLLARSRSHPGAALLAFSEEEAASFAVRSRREGDRFQPLGAGRPQKLKTFLINRKVPRAERDLLPLVVVSMRGGREGDGEIAWVAGVEIGERFRVTAATRRALWIEAVPLDRGSAS